MAPRQQGDIDTLRWEIPAPSGEFSVIGVDGYRITVRRHGMPGGLRLVLIHGGEHAIDAYYPFRSHFLDRFDCFVFDVRNHGRNPVLGDLANHGVPFFVDDSKRIMRAIKRRFGPRAVIGLFHSLTSVVALHQAARDRSFAALVLFDPPIQPPAGSRADMRAVGRRMAAVARKRRSRFDSTDSFVDSLRRNRASSRMCAATLEPFARTTLRPVADGAGSAVELRCPPEYAARFYKRAFAWTMNADFGEVPCPVKVIGSDPTVPHSFLPSTRLDQILHVECDFVPETTRSLQLEQPEKRAGRAMSCHAVSASQPTSKSTRAIACTTSNLSGSKRTTHSKLSRGRSRRRAGVLGPTPDSPRSPRITVLRTLRAPPPLRWVPFDAGPR